MGDFNSTITKRSKTNTPNPHLKNLVSNLKLKDTFKEINNNQESFTFISRQGNSTIDFILTDNIQIFKKVSHEPYLKSDHQAVIAELNCKITKNKQIKKHKSHWKLNTNLLTNDNFIYEMTSLYKKLSNKRENEENTLEWWEGVIKPNIKKLATDFNRNLQTERRKSLNWLNNILNEIKIRINKGEDKFQDYETIKNKILNIREQILNDKKQKKNFKNIVNDEGFSLSMLMAEKKNIEEKTFKKLKTKKGTTTNASEIKNIIQNFYKNLYESEKKNIDLQHIFIEGIEKEVQEEDNEDLKSEIDTHEIKLAIEQMSLNKSPGLDGLQAEFYKKFANLIAPDLKQMYKEIIRKGTLSESMNTALITLIPKGGEKTDLKNWRPISLLNVDYKILTKVLTNRLKPTLEYLISSEQAAGIKGRLITNNTATIRNILFKINHDEEANAVNKTNNESNRAAILSLDFEKAYDRVDHEFLFKVLQKYKFNSNFIKMIKIIYKKPTIQFNINGEIGRKIPIQRGVRQGCPLSMYLYILFIEPLILKLKKEIEGFKIKKQTINVLAFVDDITIITNREEDLKKTDKIIQNFENATNSKINRHKSKILGLGEWKNKRKWEIKEIEGVDNLKLLGIKIENNMQKKNKKTKMKHSQKYEKSVSDPSTETLLSPKEQNLPKPS